MNVRNTLVYRNAELLPVFCLKNIHVGSCSPAILQAEEFLWCECTLYCTHCTTIVLTQLWTRGTRVPRRCMGKNKRIRFPQCRCTLFGITFGFLHFTTTIGTGTFYKTSFSNLIPVPMYELLWFMILFVYFYFCDFLKIEESAFWVGNKFELT